MLHVLLSLIFHFVVGDEAILPTDFVWGGCRHYNEKELFFHCRSFCSLFCFSHVLHLVCPLDYDDKCDDPIMDPYGLFKYRCQTVYPHDDKLLTVDIVNASTLLRMLQHTDPYKRTWCMITLFYSPTCPFSARLAPYFNALPDMYNGSIKFVAFDATEFTKLNSRYGVSGTPTVMLWVSGAAVARMEDRTLNDMGLMSFIYDWTDVTPVFGAARSAQDPLHIEYDDRPDVFYLSLSLFVVYAGWFPNYSLISTWKSDTFVPVVVYCLRDRICENARVRTALAWMSARMDALGDFFVPQARPEQRR
ncbi:thioredoxin [Ancylostoma duodenale]|uniref:Thioredoxin n=1 Tax=Ancylostoma duodenale TaxID=51022 RepID=A0A0C2DMX7_9BILA|nr:thioredoxin [Ancylostoma duodenale]